jgi:SAM-dependent methyltransferase
MNPTSAAARVLAPTQPDLDTVKTRQQGAWSSGDYAIIGTTLQIVGEVLCEALDLRAGQKVLDVAAGNGNVTLAAARRWCEVVSTDYVPALLERGRERATAERLAIEFRQADAEALPFADASFDVVVSTFGVMFTPNQDKAATELLRVCKRGGKIGLANWTPEGFIGQLFKTIGTCRRRRASSRRRSGAPVRTSPNCLAHRLLRSNSSGATSCFATARRNTGSTYSRPTTVPS